MEIPETIRVDYLNYLINDRETILQDASQCMARLASFVDDSGSGDFTHSNLMRLVEGVTVKNILEERACHDTAPDKVGAVLDALLQCLVSVDASSTPPVDVLACADYMVRLSRHQGLLLPFFGALGEPDSISASTVSVNAVEYPAEQANESAWRHLCQRMTGLASRRLQESKDEQEYGRLVEVLLLLNTNTFAWQTYKQSRLKTLDSRIQEMFYGEGPSGHMGVVQLSQRWREFAEEAAEMLATDLRYVPLFSMSNAQDALLNHYLDTVCDEIRHFVTVLQTELVESRLAGRPLERHGSSGLKTSIRSVNESGTLDSARFDDISLGAGTCLEEEEVFLALCDTLAVFCRLENKFFGLINNHWTSPIGVDLEGSITAKKPKGVLKKNRRGSRQQSVDYGDMRQADRNPISASPVIEEGPVSVLPYLEWQTELADYLPALARSVEFHLICHWRQVKLATAPYPCPLKPHAHEGPRKVSESLTSYFGLVERILPMVLGCCEGVLEVKVEVTEVVVTSFNQTICGHMQSMLESLQTLLSGRSIDRLALAMGDGQYIQLLCFHLGTLFMPKNEKMGIYFLDRRKQYADLVTSLSTRIVDLTVHRLVTSVLQDPESTHWLDNKEFYENERVGFPIQAWHAHLERLWHALSDHTTPTAAKSAFTQVLITSLEHLVQRYANATPTFRRVTQMRGDMVAVLYLVEHCLYRVCDSGDSLLGYGDELSPVRRLHYACMSLLQVLVVGTAPLSTIHKVHSRGFYRTRDTLEHREYFPAYWLTCVNPTLYSSLKGARGPKDFLSTNMIYVQVQLFAEMPQFDATRTVELLTSCNATLSVLLLTHLAIVDANGKKGSDEIFTAFFRTFCYLSDPSDGLTLLLMPICDRTNAWSCFEKFGPSSKSQCPSWLNGLYGMIEPYVKNICSSLKSLVAMKKRKCLDLDDKVFPSGLMPCGCSPKATSRPSSSGEEYSLYSELGSQVLGQVLALPVPLQMAVVRLQSRAVERGVTPLAGHVCFHLVLRAVQWSLEKTGQWGTSGAAAVNKLCQIVEDADELHSQKEMVLNYLNRLLEEQQNIPVDQDIGLDGKRFFLSMQLNKVCSTPQGTADLEVASGLVLGNISWIRCNLGFGEEGSGFQIVRGGSTETQDLALFDPLLAAAKIGDAKFDNEKFMSGSLNWTELCSAELGLTDVGLRSLLAHRWEMRPDAVLEVDEKPLVQQLTEKFDLCTPLV